MKSRLSALLLVMAVWVLFTSATADYNVVPRPRSVVYNVNEASFVPDSVTIISYSCDDSMRRNAELLSDNMYNVSGIKLGIADRLPDSNVIVLTDTLSHTNPEAYRITVDGNRIVVDGASSAGCYFGCQTLCKSIAVPGDSNIEFPAAVITDWPQYGYRGAHLDVARHFFPVDSVKRFIDMISLHNINRFHWHLSDDQGWRIEIKSRPKLTEVASMRKETIVLHADTCDGMPHGGFYTQDEAREIVKYAADRHIVVIPEIDIPGHSQATLAAYPEVGCTGGPYEVLTRWNGTLETLCPGSDETFSLLEDVFGELVDIFPSEFINIGGDECPKDRWRECHKCQARIRQLGLTADSIYSAEDKLQGYVTRRVAEYISGLGRRVIGWDEILECDLPDNAAVLSWRGTEGALEAARRGHDAVMCPTLYCYFDYFQTENWQQEPLAGGGFIPVERVYHFIPSKGFSPDEAKHLLGVQCNHWSEAITCQSVLENRALPRMAALSEVQWSDEHKDYDDFLHRLEQLRRHYEVLGYRYAPYIFE